MKLTALLATLMLTASALTAGSVLDVPVKDIKGKDTSLKAHAGKVILVVNVASKCGLTKQYDALEATYQKFKGQGLVVAGFPCNQFGGQEPGTNEDILKFCTSKFNVTFPMFDKVEVNGPGRHPLYKELIGAGGKDIGWNFGKFLVGRDGKVIARFEPRTAPDAPEIVKAIETALAAK
jgi:glutathione peroxidase